MLDLCAVQLCENVGKEVLPTKSDKYEIQEASIYIQEKVQLYCYFSIMQLPSRSCWPHPFETIYI